MTRRRATAGTRNSFRSETMVMPTISCAIARACWPVDLSCSAAIVRENGDWRALDFSMPAGAVVPVQLEGLGSDITFKPDASVVPAATPQGWRGFLPANGVAAFAWKRTRTATEGALFFTSFELADVRVAAGLLRQTSQITFRILQGKLGSVRCRWTAPEKSLASKARMSSAGKCCRARQIACLKSGSAGRWRPKARLSSRARRNSAVFPSAPSRCG